MCGFGEIRNTVVGTADSIEQTLPRKLGGGKMLASDSDERLLSVLSALEECRAALIEGGDRETALVLSVAILELRMKINRIADSELKALCDAMVPEEAVPRSPYAKPQGQRSRPLLKLVK